MTSLGGAPSASALALAALVVVALGLAACTSPSPTMDGASAQLGTSGASVGSGGAAGASAAGAGTNLAGMNSGAMNSAGLGAGGMPVTSAAGTTNTSQAGSSPVGGVGGAMAGAASVAGASSGGSGPAGGGGGTGGAQSAGASSGGTAGSGGAGGEAFDGKELFILFGQSNMVGASPIEAQDEVTNDRVTFMVQYDCSSLGQSYGEWLVAVPPLHGCQWSQNGAIGLGPADYFAKTVAEAWADSEIGLIPSAVPGVSIDFFEPGGVSQGESYQALPEGYTSAYTMMVERAMAAMEHGRIRGILFHQGESDSGQQAWVGKVANVVANLREDLGLGEEVPFIAGELPPTACCGGHNTLVNQLPDSIPNSAVASAQGTQIHDQYHWDAESCREMGRRYAEKFLELVPSP